MDRVFFLPNWNAGAGVDQPSPGMFILAMLDVPGTLGIIANLSFDKESWTLLPLGNLLCHSE